jgi:hypothetical protein
MKTTGRKKSTNIDDRRAYFGSDSLNYFPNADRELIFLRTSLNNAALNRVEGTKIQPLPKTRAGGNTMSKFVKRNRGGR